jgi:hypothetical protein
VWSRGGSVASSSDANAAAHSPIPQVMRDCVSGVFAHFFAHVQQRITDLPQSLIAGQRDDIERRFFQVPFEVSNHVLIKIRVC